jgi:hypothetical protein
VNNLEILQAAAYISDGWYGLWAYQKWEDFNKVYFGGQLVVGGIYWGITPHGKSYGFFEGWRNGITLHMSLIDPNGRDPWGQGKLMGERMAEDVLVHEMMHQAIYQRGGDPSRFTHNSQLWCNEVNRMIPLLGIDTELVAEEIKQKRVKEDGVKGNGKVIWDCPIGAITRKALASFPQPLRPDGYYL